MRILLLSFSFFLLFRLVFSFLLVFSTSPGSSWTWNCIFFLFFILYFSSSSLFSFICLILHSFPLLHSLFLLVVLFWNTKLLLWHEDIEQKVTFLSFLVFYFFHCPGFFSHFCPKNLSFIFKHRNLIVSRHRVHLSIEEGGKQRYSLQTHFKHQNRNGWGIQERGFLTKFDRSVW